MCVCSVTSAMSDSVTPGAIAHQAPLSLRFSRQEYWSELPCPPPGDLPDPGIEPGFPVLQADSLPSEPPGNIFHILCTTCVYMEYTIIYVILCDWLLSLNVFKVHLCYSMCQCFTSFYGHLIFHHKIRRKVWILEK